MGAPVDALAAALFGKTRRAVLGLLFAEPDRTFFLREIARRVGTGQGAVQRELRRLAEAGIVRRDDVGRMVMYRTNRECPVYEELRGLIAKTAGIAEHLRQALEPLRDRIRVAFIYGSFARPAPLRRTSDIDVMIIGEVSFGEAVEHTASVQDRVGRDVNPTVYTRADFVRRVREGHHFVRDVLTREKVFLIGGQRELEQLAEGGLADDASHRPRGDSRTPRRRRPRPQR